jgi:polysaccharide chain length determinant protein (PEP-CTERM system associated)
MKSSQEFNLSQILNTIYRRKDIVIAIFLVIAALTTYLTVSLPNFYRSTTLILITPQRLPSSYVASTVTSSIDQRMLAMTQQILSRTSLEKVIRALNLYSINGSAKDIDGRVNQLRKMINIEINRNDTFKLSFEHESPQTAMEVTARLASLFIDENVRSREQQAAGTTAFMNTEVERLRKELEEQESIVNLYKSQHQKDLPEQLDANLRTLEQMRRELESGMLRLTSLEERKALIEQTRIATASIFDGSGAARSILSGAGIDSRKRELELLRTRYSDKHPDVVRLKQEIKNAPAEETPQTAGAEVAGASKLGSGDSSRTQFADIQSDVAASEITLLRQRNNKLQSEIAAYQDRVSTTPIRAMDLSKITRNYDITLNKFRDLLSKEFDSQLSENMERKQKGEQFQVVDPASLPESPVAPNRPRMLLVGLLLGLAAALGGALLIENLDNSIRGNEDLDGMTNLPLLAMLPVVPSRGNILELRQTRIMLLLYSAGALALGIFLIRMFGRVLLLS